MRHAFYYGLFAGRGRELLAETLGEINPFDLPPAEILERVVGMGFAPDLAHESRRPSRSDRAGRKLSTERISGSSFRSTRSPR